MACSRLYDRCRVSRILRQSLQINVLTLSKSVKVVRSGERWGGNLANGALELPVEKRSSLVGCEIYLLVTRLCTKQANLPSSSLVFDFTLKSRSKNLSNVTAPRDRSKV